MKKLKICHMTSAHSPEDVRIFHKECVSLARAGYEVYLIEQGKSYYKNGVHIIGFGPLPKGRFNRMAKVTRNVYKLAVSLDCEVYHFHDPELLPYWRKLKRLRKMVIFDSHENTRLAILDKEYLLKPVRWIISFFYSLYEKYVCKRLDAIITVTPTQTSYFKCINSNTFEVPNFPFFGEQYKKPDFTSCSLCFAGGIREQWNHELIINAVDRIDGCSYVLCGGENEYLNHLKNLSGWNKVRFLGMIPFDQVEEELSKCMIGVVLLTPSHNTNGMVGSMGNTKIFEVMMTGLPVICTGFVLWKDFVERYNCGICVNPEDIDEVTNAIKYLIDNPQKAREMGERGRLAVQKEYNWNVANKNLLLAYKSL